MEPLCLLVCCVGLRNRRRLDLCFRCRKTIELCSGRPSAPGPHPANRGRNCEKLSKIELWPHGKHGHRKTPFLGATHSYALPCYMGSVATVCKSCRVMVDSSWWARDPVAVPVCIQLYRACLACCSASRKIVTMPLGTMIAAHRFTPPPRVTDPAGLYPGATPLQAARKTPQTGETP